MNYILFLITQIESFQNTSTDKNESNTEHGLTFIYYLLLVFLFHLCLFFESKRIHKLFNHTYAAHTIKSKHKDASFEQYQDYYINTGII